MKMTEFEQKMRKTNAFLTGNELDGQEKEWFWTIFLAFFALEQVFNGWSYESSSENQTMFSFFVKRGIEF